MRREPGVAHSNDIPSPSDHTMVFAPGCWRTTTVRRSSQGPEYVVRLKPRRCCAMASGPLMPTKFGMATIRRFGAATPLGGRPFGYGLPITIDRPVAIHAIAPATTSTGTLRQPSAIRPRVSPPGPTTTGSAGALARRACTHCQPSFGTPGGGGPNSISADWSRAGSAEVENSTFFHRQNQPIR
jgi:hypothetical protein